MTRQIFLNTLLVAFLATVFTSFNNAAFAGNSAIQNKEQSSFETGSSQEELPIKPVSMPGAIGLKPPVHKMQLPVMEELPKLHRFHKERVKKLKKHHKKCWISAKLLLVVCHVALLVCAFMHATH
jgi:hypothetical protein